MRASTVFRETGEVALAAPIFAASPLLRHWHVRWGATDEEVAAAMPGDLLVAKPSFAATRAITIDAPPEAVWPWIVQVGFGRAGFYSYDLFDNACRPSATSILNEHQEPRVGDLVPMASKVNETTAFRVASVEANRSLLWTKAGSTWAWTLSPLADGRATRLVTRLKAIYPWRSSFALAFATLVLFEHGDFPMMRKMLLGIRARAEREVRNA
jgi:hypothetical protein